MRHAIGQMRPSQSDVQVHIHAIVSRSSCKLLLDMGLSVTMGPHIVGRILAAIRSTHPDSAKLPRFDQNQDRKPMNPASQARHNVGPHTNSGTILG